MKNLSSFCPNRIKLDYTCNNIIQIDFSHFFMRMIDLVYLVATKYLAFHMEIHRSDLQKGFSAKELI